MPGSEGLFRAKTESQPLPSRLHRQSLLINLTTWLAGHLLGEAFLDCPGSAGALFQAYLRDIAGMISDHHNKANNAIKQTTCVYGSYVYTTL